MSGSYTATYDITGPIISSVTLEISNTANGSGDYPVNSISGTWDGSAITGLINFDDNNNLAVPPGNGGFDDVDEAGFSFSTADGRSVNVFDSLNGLGYDSIDSNGFLTATFTTNVPCFLRGTQILTARGDIAVEDLSIGDRVLTITGQALPIKWIGTRRYLPDPIARKLWASVAPIRIRRGAIADNIPCRDLLVSPDHSLFLGSHLINAKNLVNGVTIFQDTRIADIAYFHIELERHEVILAEGAPVETYLDNANRTQFHNASTHAEVPSDQHAPLSAWYAPHAYGPSPALKYVRDLLAAPGASLAPPLAEAA